METNRNKINQHNSHELIFHNFLYRFLSFPQEGVVELFHRKIKVVFKSVSHEHGDRFAEGRAPIPQEEKKPNCKKGLLGVGGGGDGDGEPCR